MALDIAGADAFEIWVDSDDPNILARHLAWAVFPSLRDFLSDAPVLAVGLDELRVIHVCPELSFNGGEICAVPIRRDLHAIGEAASSTGAVERVFGRDIDFAQVIKDYGIQASEVYEIAALLD